MDKENNHNNLKIAENLKATEEKKFKLTEEEAQHLQYIEDFLTSAKKNVFKNKKLTADSILLLKDILDCIEDNNSDEKYRIKLWETIFAKTSGEDFYEILAHCLLCEQTFRPALRILCLSLENVRFMHELYRSRKFSFFLAEKLFGCILKMYSTRSMHEIDQMDEDEIKTIFEGKRLVSVGSNNPFRDIVRIINLMLKIDRNLLAIVQASGIFQLMNSFPIKEVAEVYNAVFYNVEFEDPEPVDSSDPISFDLYKNFKDGAVFEIQRPKFQPEVLLKNKTLFSFRDLPKRIRSSELYENLYENLMATIFKELVEFFPEETYNVLAYKSTNYCSDAILKFMIQKFSEIDVPIRNKSFQAKKYEKRRNIETLEKLCIYYRKYLEAGNPPETNLLRPLLANMASSKELSLSVVLILYFYVIYGVGRDMWQYINTRAMFQTLEFDLSKKSVIKILTVLKAVYQKDGLDFYTPTYFMLLRFNLGKIESNMEICGFVEEYFLNFIENVRENKSMMGRVFLKKTMRKMAKKPKKTVFKLEEQPLVTNTANSSTVKGSFKLNSNFIESGSDENDLSMMKTIPETSFKDFDM